MFVLRRIPPKSPVRDTGIGESYLLIDAERDPEDYKKSLATLKVSEDKDIYGFISHSEGTKLIPLYVNSTYFIMSENGATFANISKK
jgi:hypothetical protein